MNNQIFRKKSLEKVSSPDQLNDYVRVSNPGIWMVMAAIIVLLFGVCVWGIFGKMETKVSAPGVCRNGKLTCYIQEASIEKVQEGMDVTAGGKTFPISQVDRNPVMVDEDMDTYLMHLGEFQYGEWVYAVTAETSLEDGTYDASVITERVSPMSFVMN